MVVPMTWPTLRVVSSALIISFSLAATVMCMGVPTVLLLGQERANNTRTYGINMSYAMDVSLCLASLVLYADHRPKTFLGFLNFNVMPLLMMILSLMILIITTHTFSLVVSTVWRQYVHHVVLLLRGPSFASLNLQQTFCISWRQFTQQRSLVLTMFALTKHAWSFEEQSLMAAGILGEEQHALLWTHITTSTTVLKTTFAASGAIQLL